MRRPSRLFSWYAELHAEGLAQPHNLPDHEDLSSSGFMHNVWCVGS